MSTWLKVKLGGAKHVSGCGGRVRGINLLLLISVFVGVGACKNPVRISTEQARAHVQMLVALTVTDVAEVRNGLPKGAEQLGALFRTKRRVEAGAGSPGSLGAEAASLPPTSPPEETDTPDFQAASEGLSRARRSVQDLRVAKSTFFALVGLDGIVIRTDGEQDLMAGKSMFAAFPGLKPHAMEKYVETRGTMLEAAQVRGRADGQWVAGLPVVEGGKTRAVYATGWSWAAYAYRLENAVRGNITSELGAKENLPLVYVYIVVDGMAQGAPVSPDVNAAAILKTEPLEHARDAAVFATELTIDGRDFGLAVQRAPALGPDIAIAVLRSEV